MKMYDIYVTLFFGLFTSNVLRYGDAQTRTNMEDLHQNLLNNSASEYYKNVRPDSNQATATSVTTDLYISSLRELEEMTGRFTVVAFLKIKWTDERMQWTPGSYGSITEIEVPQVDVWRPELSLANPFALLKKLGTDNTMVQYKNTGEATWMVGDVMQATCDIDVTHYPFDRQTCPLYFLIWGYDVTDVYLSPTSNDVSFEYYTQNSEWDFTKSEKGVVSSTYPYIVYKFYLARKSDFFIISIYIPVVLMTSLCTLVFLLPADSGERVGYSITCLLAVAVFLTIVSERLPRSSSPVSVLSFFLMCDFVLACALCVLTIVGLRLHHKDSEVHGWIQKIMSCRLFCQKKETSSDERNPTKVTWKDISRFYDMVCFFLSIGACAVLMVVYLMFTNIVQS